MAFPLCPPRLALVCGLVLSTLPAWAQDRLPQGLPSPLVATTLEDSASHEALNAELLFEVLVGEMSAMEGDMANATALMLEAARQSNNPQLYRRATELALQSRSGERALITARAWKQAFPASREANRYLLQILLLLNRVADTAEPLRQEIATASIPSKPAVYLGIAQLYSRVSDKKLAADIVEQAMGPDLVHPVTGAAAWATVGHLRVIAGQTPQAFDAAKKGNALAPNNGATALLAMELLEAGVAEAEPLVTAYLADQPSATMRMAYARVLLGQQQTDRAREQMERITQETPEFAEAWLGLAGLQANDRQWTQAQLSLRSFIPLAEQIADSSARTASLNRAYLLHAQIAMEQQAYPEADTWLQKIEGGEQLLNVQSMRALLLAKQGKLAQGRALIRNLPAQTAGQERLKRLAEVQLLREANAPQEAYLLQLTLQQQNPNDNELAYDTALLAEKAGKYDAMEKLLREIIARQPDFHHAYNALGYSFAERGIRLDEAKGLIEKALSFAPEDPFITDSLAWVEFRRGNLSAAQTLLEKAYGLRDDVEIATHLGEVLWAQGQKDRALAIWRQALEQDARNEALQSTLRRLGAKP